MKMPCFRHNWLCRNLWIQLLALVLTGVFQAQAAQVVINEILVNNQHAYANDAGHYNSWIELYNPTTQPVDLSNWGLTDSQASPLKYVFPAGTSIAAKGCLLVWCDNDTTVAGLHTGWTLKDNGDDVALFDPTGLVRVDYVVFGLQLPDVSLARSPDGGTAWQPSAPTPLEANQPLPTAAVTSGTIKINEWMASASKTNDASNPNGDDWFELYNTNTNLVDLGGLYLANTASLVGWTNPPFPQFSFMPGNGFLRIWADKKTSPPTHVNFRLGAGGDSTWLIASDQLTEIDHVDFGVQSPDISQGRLPDGNANIVFFTPVGKATPGDSNFQWITNVVLNEVLAHSDPPLEDAIELLNPTTQPVEISNWWLSNSRDDPKKFHIPANTVIAPGGFKVFYEYQFNPDRTGAGRSFTLNSAQGDEIYLYSSDAAGTILGGRVSKSFGATENGVSLGRYLTSAGNVDLVPMSRPSFGTTVSASDPPQLLSVFRTGLGATNPCPKIGPLVISEVMYHPPNIVTPTATNDNSLEEYVELYNVSGQTVTLYDNQGNLSGFYYDPNYPYVGVNHDGLYADGRTNTWHVRGDIDFDFPTNVTLRAGESLLLVNFNPLTNLTQLEAFRAKYGLPPAVQLAGPYKGKLPNSLGKIELLKPDPPQGPSHPDFGEVPYIFVEKLEYADATPWPLEADGFGAALERINLGAYGNDPQNWRPAAPSPGRNGQPVSFTSITRSGGSLLLKFNATEVGSSFTLQYRNTLNPTEAWQKWSDVLVGTNTGPQQVTLPLPPGTRFFRLMNPAGP
jgi:hypothetical protein